MELIAAGLSFRTAPLDVRERAAVAESQSRTLLRFLVGHSGLSEAAVLSTCNRTELYLVSPLEGMAGEICERLVRYLDPGGDGGVAEHLVARTGADAVRHMFRVAAGLDSMVLGEAQILGQFRAAHRLALEAGTLDTRLDFVMRRALSVAKRVRTETGLGRHSGSVGGLALRWARRQLGTLEGRGVLVLGAGAVSTPMARRLAAEGARLHVVSRGGISAARLADEVDGVAVEVERLEDVIAAVDLVICSTDSAQPVLRLEDVARCQEIRGHRPLCIVDIAVPRDVEPEAGGVPGVVLTDLDSLGTLADLNRAGTRSEVPAAEAIVDAEVPSTVELIAERDATAPTIASLVSRAEEVRRAEVERSMPGLGQLDPAGRAQVEALTRSLVRKLLHAPIAHLRESGGDPKVALLLREAFDLDARGRDAAGTAPPATRARRH